MFDNVATLLIYVIIFAGFITIGALISDFMEYRQERRRKNRWWRGN